MPTPYPVPVTMVTGTGSVSLRRAPCYVPAPWVSLVRDRQAGVDRAQGVKGVTKQAAGAVLGDKKLEQEGRAQREKGEAKRTAAAKEAEAGKSRAEARLHEAEQAVHQHR